MYKCCFEMGADELLAEYTLDEWLNCDIYQECLKHKDFSPKHHTERQYHCEPQIKKCECHDCQLRGVVVGLNFECNLKCVWCAQSENKDKVRTDKATAKIKDAYFKTLYALKGHNIDILRFTERGEPFFYRKELKEFIKSCTKDDFGAFVFTTNATLIDDEMIQIMKDSGIECCFNVSLNAATKEDYKRITGFDGFDLVKGNIYKIKEFAQKLSISFVIDEVSIKNIDAYIPMFEEYKQFAELIVNLSYQYRTELSKNKENIPPEYEKLKPYLCWIKA